jgi:hypothetical protein
MKAKSLQNFEKKSLLRIVKNSLKNKSANHKLQINTLTPGFTYINHMGKTVTPTGVI